MSQTYPHNELFLLRYVTRQSEGLFNERRSIAVISRENNKIAADKQNLVCKQKPRKTRLLNYTHMTSYFSSILRY